MRYRRVHPARFYLNIVTCPYCKSPNQVWIGQFLCKNCIEAFKVIPDEQELLDLIVSGLRGFKEGFHFDIKDLVVTYGTPDAKFKFYLESFEVHEVCEDYDP